MKIKTSMQLTALLSASLLLFACGSTDGSDINKNAYQPKLATGETYPTYYNDIERIVIKDVMTKWFDETGKGILSYGLEDAVRAEGHACYLVTGGFLMAREGLKALKKKYEEDPNQDVTSSYDYEDKVMYRGGIKVTMSGEEGTGSGLNAVGGVLHFITGASGSSGFKKGPDFPFANRQNLFAYDSNMTGVKAIFTSMTTTYTMDGEQVPYSECKGTWMIKKDGNKVPKCIETTACDKSIKISYSINTPKDKPWTERVKYILDHVDEAITIEDVDNPAKICN